MILQKKTLIGIFIFIQAFLGSHAQTLEQWNDDLDFLLEKYETLYPQLFAQVDSTDFYKLATQVRNGFDAENPAHNILGLFRIHAFLKDAHSIPMIFHPAYQLRAFPLRVFHFKEGWFVMDAKPGFEYLIGKKLIRIENTPIKEIFDWSSEIISSENNFGKLDRFNWVGMMPEWLVEKKVISQTDSAAFYFETEGKEIRQVLPSISLVEHFNWNNIEAIKTDSYFTFSNPRDKNYWFDFDKNILILYFQFNAVENQEGEATLAEFSEQLQKFVERNDIRKFIIDLRNNYGGDDSYLPPLFDLIRNNKKINTYGKLFVLAGRHTFSSGLLFAWKLRLQTEAIFVGEPSGQGPVFNANAEYVFLPNSKIGFTVSKTSTERTQPKWIFSAPSELKPDFKIDYSINNFLTKTDSALDFVKNFTPKTEVLKSKNNLKGRYKLSDFYIADFQKNKQGVKMIVSDYIKNSLFRIEKQLYFDETGNCFSDRNHLFEVKYTDEKGKLKLCFYDDCKILNSVSQKDMIAFEALQAGKYDQALSLIKQNSESYKSNFTRLEYFLTMAGYDLLNHNKIELSLEYFKLVVDMFPDSWNAYDSYGEALLKAGRIKESILNYEKSIELNPDNKNGMEQLKIIRKKIGQ